MLVSVDYHLDSIRRLHIVYLVHYVAARIVATHGFLGSQVVCAGVCCAGGCGAEVL
jgi:hypothetical protein